MKNYFLLAILFFSSLSFVAQTSSGKHHIKYLEINTMQSDYGVTFLDDENLVFTAPSNEKTKNPQQDLFVGEIDPQGEIVKKERVKGIVSNKITKTGIAYSSDSKTVYFSAKKYKRRKRSKDKYELFKARIDSIGNWTDMEKLPFNSKRYSTEQPALSKDGKKLFFVSDRPSSIGGSDIFVVKINDDGTFGEPINLGDKINTRGDEVTPYVTDNNILYFSSNGHEGGYGNLDVYASEIFENNVSEPLHLESPINSLNDDFAYIVNSKNNSGYFSSNRLQGQDNNDIYAFTIEEDKPEKCQQEIAGIVRDKNTNELLKDAAITLFDNDGNQVQQVLTDKDGIYKLDLDCSQTYTLVASSLHYSKEEHIINTANYNNAPDLTADKYLVKNLEDAISDVSKDNNATTTKEEAKEEVVENLNAIYFDFDKSSIREDATDELDKIVKIMKENSNVKIEVTSYTDSRGSSAYNLKLSERRAKSSIDYIVSKGIDRNRLTGKGLGESRMVNKCINGVECSETAHQNNRRTEFAILNQSASNTTIDMNTNQGLASHDVKPPIAKSVNTINSNEIFKKKS